MKSASRSTAARRSARYVTITAYAGLCLAGLASVPEHVSAQRPWRTGPGDRVRVSSSELQTSVVGILVSLDNTWLVLDTGGESELILSIGTVTTVEVSQGRRPVNVSPGRGAFLAAGACVVAGVVINDYEGLALVLAGLSICPLAGAAFGAVMGRERWEAAVPTAMPVGASTVRRAFTLSWSLPLRWR